MITDEWWSCYGQGLKGLISDASMAHPAKVSLALARRIYQHALDEGWVVPGHSLCVDPMAGVATFGLVAATFGIHWLGIELEERFVALGQGNIALHTKEWLALGKPLPMLVQGDARYLREIITEASCVVSSPPYANGCRQTGGIDAHPEHIQGGHNGHVLRQYSQPAAIVSSPPYANSVDSQACGIDWTKMGPATGTRQRGPGTKHHETLTAQLSYQQPQAIVSSPPFLGGTDRDPRGESLLVSANEKQGHKHKDPYVDGRAKEYGATSGQLGAMPEGSLADVIVTSPPYEAAASNCATNHGKEGKAHWKAGGIAAREGLEGYGDANGHVGNLSHESYWSEMLKVYTACWDVLPLGGHLILVLKSFVRRGAIVDLPMQTAQLLEHVGFTVLHYHRAMLSSPVGQARLFDDGEDRTSRKSFFRRLAENRGSPVIDHEAILCAEKV